MKQYALIAVITCMVSNPLCASDTEKVLIFENLAGNFSIPFSDKMTIKELKERFKSSEGSPGATVQLILKKREWVRKGYLWPSQESVLLEDDKTCADYDLQNNSKVQLSFQLCKKTMP